MRIVVNDIAASTGGAMTVLRDFYNCVCDHDRENEWIFLLGDRYFEETDNVKIITLPQIKGSHLRKLWFDFISGRRFINRLMPDVVLSLQNIITMGVKAPQAVYIHQSIPFQSIKRFSFLREKERKLAVIQHLIGWVIKNSAKKSDLVIVQAQWLREAVCSMCRLPKQKVRACLPPIKSPAFEVENSELEQATFFYPTADAIYKNNTCVFQASEMLDKKNIAHQVTMTLPPEQGRGSIVCTGRLPYEQVQGYYQRATLVFSSYVESFGYPLAEGRMAGTVVLAADTPFAREVLDGYENAYFFAPFKPAELACLMERVISGELGKKPVAKKKVQETNSWEQIADWVLDLK